jgi:hypothetical protein
VDTIRKFGCNGPVGIYADEYAALCIRKSLTEADYAAFHAYAEDQQSMKDASHTSRASPISPMR